MILIIVKISKIARQNCCCNAAKDAHSDIIGRLFLPIGLVMLSLFFKSLLGAAAVLIIAAFSKSKVFYIAGLVPLFPTFALIAHVIVAQEKGAEALRQTALFGLWSLIPYFIYLLLVYVLALKLPLWSCLGLAAAGWIAAAAVLIYLWQQF